MNDRIINETVSNNDERYVGGRTKLNDASLDTKLNTANVSPEGKLNVEEEKP